MFRPKAFTNEIDTTGLSMNHVAHIWHTMNVSKNYDCATHPRALIFAPNQGTKLELLECGSGLHKGPSLIGKSRGGGSG